MNLQIFEILRDHIAETVFWGIAAVLIAVWIYAIYVAWVHLIVALAGPVMLFLTFVGYSVGVRRGPRWQASHMSPPQSYTSSGGGDYYPVGGDEAVYASPDTPGTETSGIQEAVDKAAEMSTKSDEESGGEEGDK